MEILAFVVVFIICWWLGWWLGGVIIKAWTDLFK
jgi:hypothetical protein